MDMFGDIFFQLTLCTLLWLSKESGGEPPSPTKSLFTVRPPVIPKDGLILGSRGQPGQAPCNRSREIITDSTWGIISDGPTNYTQDTTCEWLISAPSGHWISLQVDRVMTECSYDYLFIVDGLSYLKQGSQKGYLLASFSGASHPQATFLAQSGHMLILLYSDPNYLLEGFQAEYSISPCPLNCSSAGECITLQNGHACRCEDSRYGVACELEKPVVLSSTNTSFNTSDRDNEQAHETKSAEFNSQRVIISKSWQSPLARVGHSAVRLKDDLFIYGGFDLNNILDDLFTVDLLDNRIKRLGNWSLGHSSGWPVGRFGHAFVRIGNGFLIHGGKTAKGVISNDMYYYNATTSSWKQHPDFEVVNIDEKLKFIPPLIYHSMTRTSSGHIFVYGGGKPGSQFSSVMHRFHEENPANWTVVYSTCCGKPTHRSVLGHTMTYWKDKHALILFGGVGSSEFGRFSRLSSQLWIFLINSSTWLQLDYKKNGGGVPTGIHPERAFHTAHLTGHYLSIVGGYTHVHNREETCYSDQILVYNLECQIFLPQNSPRDDQAHDIQSKGFFGHQSILFKKVLLVIGGYRGYLNQDIDRRPFMFGDTDSSECHNLDRSRCKGDPRCGWCPTNYKCFEKLSAGSNCTANLQTIQCPGLCPLLTNCRACVIPGCTWCGNLEQCKNTTDNESPFCNSNPHLSQPIQNNLKECTLNSLRMGPTQFEYRFPQNFSTPDIVKIINSSTLVVSKEYLSSVSNDVPVTFALRGSLLGSTFGHHPKILELCALQASVNLTMSTSEDSMVVSIPRKDHQVCQNLTWPSGKAVLIVSNQNIRFHLLATSFGKGLSQDKSGRVTIQQRFTGPSPLQSRLLRKEHFLPFQSGNFISSDNELQSSEECDSYSTCLGCVGDGSCTWDTDFSKCFSRSQIVGGAILGNVSKLGERSLIILPENCPLCVDISFCDECVSNGEVSIGGQLCEWWEEEMTCQRRGRLVGAVRHEDNCSSLCSTRNNCTACLESPGKCVWCEQQQECFVFSVYTSLFQFGQCFQWMDKKDQCKRCDRQPTCESCILNMGCGWSYDESGGTCLEGDFGGSYKTLSNLLGKDSDGLLSGQELELEGSNKTWTYGGCPDVDECELGIHDCHTNATCINTPGSFICLCRMGFTGDGRQACDQTCHEPCVHGTCSAEFICLCELGWTGSDCSIDCGCNNHSYCKTGNCDECRDWTIGEHCELCSRGSFGNATVFNEGCSACNCNGHGDHDLGQCDLITGNCFCLNNTTGADCSVCAVGFYGDPTEGRPCYRSCSGRTLIESPRGHFGLTSDSSTNFNMLGRKKHTRNQVLNKNVSNYQVEHCMWIIKAPEDKSEFDFEVGIEITIDPEMSIPCTHNVIQIYAGFSEVGVDTKKIPLVAAVCNDDRDPLLQHGRETTVTVSGRVATVLLRYARIGTAKFPFNASFKVVNLSTVKDPGVHGFNAFTNVNISRLYDGPSLSVLSRYGHSLHVDERNLWIFGGYSLSHGPLNDVRHFSRESNSWVPLTITVIQNDEAVPPARYFHGGVISPNLEIFIHGGISVNLTFYSDSWRFDTKTSRWSKFCEGPNESPKLAGHTLTLRQGSGQATDAFTIVMIGGFNPEEGFSDNVFSIGPSECWQEVETTGSNPVGLYGHSSVYHENSDTFYVFGGTLHDIMGMHQVAVSNRLFALHWKTRRWSVLSPIDDNQIGMLPPPRFLHSGVSTKSYMIILGGIGPSLTNASILVYVYQCNLWLVAGKDFGTAVLKRRGAIQRMAGASGVSKNEIVQMGGWTDGSTSESLFLISIPSDPCELQKSKERCKGTVGCSFCSSNNNQTQQCYNAEMEMPSKCSSGASSIEFWQGATCSAEWIGRQGCGRFQTCTECLAGWSSHPNISQVCEWCTNGKTGKCIPLGKKFEDEKPCGSKHWEITDSTDCPERICSAPQCEKCISSGKCIWTRQILRSRERSWELRLQPVYDWNCVRKSILETSPSVAVVSSPPASCPIPCWHFDSCQECLEAPGAEGGFHQCFWSVNQRRCVSPAYSPLLCFGGICGPILKGPPSICPKSCTVLRSCSACLEDPSCGWCSSKGENGEGVCLSASLLAETNFCPNGSDWNYLNCPKENECVNGHHGCDPNSEQCVDLEIGYQCRCREGYERVEELCLPICSDGCVHGSCVEPGKCMCHFGYVGSNCSFQCDCNGHSNCAGVDKLDECLDCRNNTMGPKCSQCKPMFVGDPKNNGACIACVEYCNGHSSICVSYDDYNKFCNGTDKFVSSSQLMSTILSGGLAGGPFTTAYCCHCKNQTSGDTCNECNKGYFRGYDEKRLPCRKCQCHGHGDVCDPVTGHSCNCHNNTESEHCSQNTLKQNLNHQCWRHQCSKCKDSYIGNPIDGRQCYKVLSVDQDYCFDPNSHGSCAVKQKPLVSGRTVFFAVQPKFMNVNIRVTLDVTHGAVNVYLSPKEDTFLIKQEKYNWIHRVEFGAKYSLSGDKKESSISKNNMQSSSGEGNKAETDYEFPITNKTEELEENGTTSATPKINTSVSGFIFIEHEAAGYATYFSVQNPKAILLVKNLRNRLVITLPQDCHDLRDTRFYLVLEGIGDVSYGSIFFRQDQLHIDLFVFFSVFFSAFFLFLSGCGVAWKIKQNMEARRARNRHVAEMLSMAKRPFATWTILVEPESGSSLMDAYNQCRKSCRKGCICIRPVAVEWNAGNHPQNGVSTMFISLPGGSAAPVRLCLGSVLANIQRSHQPYHARRRRL